MNEISKIVFTTTDRITNKLGMAELYKIHYKIGKYNTLELEANIHNINKAPNDISLSKSTAYTSLKGILKTEKYIKIGSMTLWGENGLINVYFKGRNYKNVKMIGVCSFYPFIVMECVKGNMLGHELDIDDVNSIQIGDYLSDNRGKRKIKK